MGTIGKVLPYINGFLMAIKETIKTFALFMGFKMPDSSNVTGTIMDNMETGAEDFGEALGGAVDNANTGLDKAKKTVDSLLAPFDKLNILQKPKEDTNTGSGSVGGTVGGLTVDPRILEALNKYQYVFDNIEMKATRISKELTEWLNVAGQFINKNIFESMKSSWDIYGRGTLQEFSSGFGNITELIKGYVEVWGRQFKPFFQATSDLFNSLLETVGIVFNTITEIFLDVWNSGGKKLYEQLFRLSTSIIKLGTSINDNFVKPMIKWFRDNLAPVFSAVVGSMLGLLGNVIGIIADLTTSISKNKTMVVLLGTAFTTMFATIKIAKFIDLVSKMEGSHRVLKALTNVLYDHSKTFKLAYNSWVGGSSALSKLRGMLTSANTALASTTLFTKAQELAAAKCAESTGFLSTAMKLLAGHPLVAVAGAIAVVVGSIGLFIASQQKSSYEMEDYSKHIQNNIKDLKGLEDGMKSAQKSAKESLIDNQANVKVTEKYIDVLKNMTSEDGYVGNIEKAKIFIEKINAIMPDTVKLTEEGRIEWQKTPEEINKVIASLKKKAEMDAYEQLYVESIKASIKATQEQDEAIKESNKIKRRIVEINKEIENGNPSYKIRKELKQLKADQDGLNKVIDDSGNVIDKAKTNMKHYEDKLTDINTSIDITSKAFENLSQKQINSFNSLSTGFATSLEALRKHTDGTKLLTDKQLLDTQQSISLQIAKYAEKSISYGKSFDDMLAILTQQGITLSEEEKRQAQATYDALKLKNDEQLASFKLHKQEVLKEVKESNKNLTKEDLKQYSTLLDNLNKFGIDITSKNKKVYSEILQICVQSGVDVNSKEGAKYSSLLGLLDQYGVNVKSKNSSQYYEMLTTAETNGINFENAKGRQYVRLLALLDTHNINYNSKQGKQYIQELLDNQNAGSKSGKAFVDSLDEEMNDKKGKVKNSSRKTGESAKNEIEKIKPVIDVKAKVNNQSVYNVGKSIADQLGNISANIKVSSKGKISFNVRGYADGGFPEVGQLFIANEKGPELIGSNGGRSMVANQNQITDGIREASYQGMSQALREVRTNKADGTTVIEVYLGNELIETQIVKANDKHERMTGKPVFSRS